MNVQYPNIGNQVTLINTNKYYLQSLGSLSASTDKLNKENIRKLCESFIKKFNYFADVYHFLADEEKAWVLHVLHYLSADKRFIPYKKVKTYKDLLAQPEGRFFAETEFYSLIRNEIMGDKEYEDVRKFFKKFKRSK